jgi:hypothetical protein
MNQNRSTIIVGAILIIVGLAFLVGQSLDLVQIELVWPMIIIAAGAAFFIGMLLGGKATGALAIPGSIIAMVGLILLVQDLTGWWESWSYAWALIIVAVGIGTYIFGVWSDKPELRKSGWDTIKVGVTLFIVFGAIFAFIFTLTGTAQPGMLIVWSLLLVAVAVFQLVSKIYHLATHQERKDDRDLFGPFFLATLGLMALFYSLGWMDGDDFLRVLNLWPLLLIAAGLQLIFGRHRAWVSALLGILFLGGVMTTIFAGEQLNMSKLTIGNITTSISAGDWPVHKTVTGSGVQAEESREVSDFTKVSLESFGDMEIVQGSSESLVVIADDNLLPYIKTEVSNGKLIITTERGVAISPKTTIRYQLQVKNLEEVRISGAGSVQVASLETSGLELVTSGAGSFKVEDLQADQFSGVISGAGSITASGKVDGLNITISGAGSFNGADLESRQAEVRISGLGKATVWVSEILETNISGAGSISYYGSPDVSEHNSGAGIVQKVGDK